MKRILLLALPLLLACSKNEYEIADPKPNLTVTAMQSVYTVDEAAYIQLSVSQRGYDGSFLLSAVVDEGECTLSLGGRELATDGAWTSLANATEIVTLTPRQPGALRLSFEVKTANSDLSGRSFLNLTVLGSTALGISFTGPETASISSPIRLTLLVSKNRFEGQLPVKFVPLSGEGTLQFGAVAIEGGASFSCPPNIDQTLYYTAAERGVHTLQLSVTDGFTTKFAVHEVIVTN